MGVTLSLRVPMVCHRSSAYPAQKAIYLFVQHPSTFQASLEIYWSLNSDGTQRLSDPDVSSFGLNKTLRPTRKVLAYRPSTSRSIDALEKFQRMYDINPFSTQASEMLEVPLARIHVQ